MSFTGGADSSDRVSFFLKTDSRNSLLKHTPLSLGITSLIISCINWSNSSLSKLISCLSIEHTKKGFLMIYRNALIFRKLNSLLKTNMNKTDIKDFIISHLKIQQLTKQMKIEKENRKSLEQTLYSEFKKRGLNSYDLGKFRIYVYDVPVPRLMIYNTKES